MSPEEIKSVAALCYLEQAWTVIPRAEQAIALCEMFLARLAERAEPDGWIDGEGDPYCQHGWGKQPPAGWTTCEENAYPVFRHPFSESAPHEQCMTSAINAVTDSDADEAPVGAAPLPEEVRKIVKKLRHHHDPHYCVMLAAADMLERMATCAAIPDGYALVPREHTYAMHQAWIEAADEDFSGRYAALIAAGEKK